MRIWEQQPKAKAHKSEYQNRPEVKARRKITQKAYVEEHKEELRIYHQEYDKAYGPDYWAKPKNRARAFLNHHPEINTIRNYPKTQNKTELVEQLADMILQHKANPVCECGCGIKEDNAQHPWCIDHKENVIRGMITQHCNIHVLGHYEKLSSERKKQLDDYINGKTLISV